MAMIKCPECGREISDKATTCPECGYALNSEELEKNSDELKDNEESEINKTSEINEEISTKKEFLGRKRIKIAAIAVGVVLVLIVAFFLTGDFRDYYNAVGLLEDKEYQEARNEFVKLEGYKDSDDKIMECEYQMALSFIESEEYEKAIDMLKNPLVNKYKDSQEQKNFCEYQIATKHYNNKEYAYAIEKLTVLAEEDYKDSSDVLVKAKYELGKKYLDEKSYEEALDLLKSIEYKDSAELVEAVENNPYSLKKFIERYNSMADQIEKLIAGVSIKRLDANNLNNDVITTGLGAEIRFNRSADEKIDCRYDIESFMWELSPWLLADPDTVTAEWHCCMAGMMTDFKMNEISDIIVKMVDSSGGGIYGSTEYKDLFFNISKTKKVITISGKRN